MRRGQEESVGPPATAYSGAKGECVCPLHGAGRSGAGQENDGMGRGGGTQAALSLSYRAVIDQVMLVVVVVQGI
ncbi:hypothetical protein E2C01_097812 [Portunus trituberculatus]|uniref:Uncharacterized protein n=1 Tax=Portunus trituberculatus TaxID=210409 RepID=A0A5B7JZL3_PORTR|nr:hypothetical protein [Portunus trituberculatus]